jgi:hypothetical protein
MDGNNKTQNQPQIQTQLALPYMVGFNLPYLIKLINDPIRHETIWPTMLTKLPSISLSLRIMLKNTPSIISCCFTFGAHQIVSWMTRLELGCSNSSKCRLAFKMVYRLAFQYP